MLDLLAMSLCLALTSRVTSHVGSLTGEKNVAIMGSVQRAATRKESQSVVSHQFREIGQFESPYSQRLFELLVQHDFMQRLEGAPSFSATKQRYFRKDELDFLFGTEAEGEGMPVAEKLDMAISEINDKSRQMRITTPYETQEGHNEIEGYLVEFQFLPHQEPEPDIQAPL